MARTHDNLIRYSHESRKKLTNRVNAPYRYRKKRPAIKLTPSQKAARTEKRNAEKAEVEASLQAARDALWAHATQLAARFGSHNADYYYQSIMQQPKKRSRRAISKWNAFMSLGVKQHNQGRCPGNRERVDNMAKTMSQKWQQMNKEEKDAVTAGLVEQLEDRRNEKATASHNVPLASLGDAHRTIISIEQECRNLSSRTGTQILMIAVRSDTGSYNKPRVFYTDERIPDFVQSTLGTSVQEVSLRMEAYCIAGMPQQASTRGEIRRIYYAKFEENITAKYGVVLRDWPAGMSFRTPSDISSPTELEVLKHAWESGTARFESLSDDAWAQWLKGWAVRMGSSSETPGTSTAPPLTPGTATLPSSLTSIDTAPHKRVRVERPPPTVEFINSGATMAGDTYVVPKGQRRPRSDKGVPRGPRKRKPTVQPTEETATEAGAKPDGGQAAKKALREKKSKKQKAPTLDTVLDFGIGPST
ncbi:hypothetical protein BV20DRAFT_959252 [Pilatotrama ljubarskyi]|nr:hypothetical protein BV20DRAFT_959252 [Pilatotrama ljubarskyi]